MKIHYESQKVLLILGCSSEEFSLIQLFCDIFLKFEWEITYMFLYELPKISIPYMKVLSPEFLLDDGVKTSLQTADLV